MSITDLIPWNWGKKNVPVKHDKIADPFYELQRRMNNVFDDVWNDFGFSTPMKMPELENMGAFAPSIDLKETDKEVAVKAELPGMSENDIQVELSDGLLKLKGEKKDEKSSEKDGAKYSECSYGSFYRSIALPEGIDEENINAEFKNGVLTITLPKTETAKQNTKRIEVKHG